MGKNVKFYILFKNNYIQKGGMRPTYCPPKESLPEISAES